MLNVMMKMAEDLSTLARAIESEGSMFGMLALLPVLSTKRRVW